MRLFSKQLGDLDQEDVKELVEEGYPEDAVVCYLARWYS